MKGKIKIVRGKEIAIVAEIEKEEMTGMITIIHQIIKEITQKIIIIQRLLKGAKEKRKEGGHEIEITDQGVTLKIE